MPCLDSLCAMLTMIARSMNLGAIFCGNILLFLATGSEYPLSVSLASVLVEYTFFVLPLSCIVRKCGGLWKLWASISAMRFRW